MIEVTTHIPNSFSTATIKTAPLRPSHVVYKTARIAFDKNGEPLPQYRRSMLSVLTDFHALIHPLLFQHPNVIEFLGIAWGSNPFSSQHRLPALIVEYAEHGTLAQVLSNEKKIDSDLNHMLCLDVARGLSALHQVGLVHGDIKAENVLICSSPDRKYTAKISDFGFSIMAATENKQVWMGGTDPWRAPETKRGSIPIDLVAKTDVYSLGLLAWVILLNGQNPFNFLADHTLEKGEIEAMKQDNSLLYNAKEKEWLHRYLQNENNPIIKQSYEEIALVFAQHELPNMTNTKRKAMLSMIRDELIRKLESNMQQGKLMKGIDHIFEYCLASKPLSRDLDLVLKVLESSLDGEDHSRKEEVESTAKEDSERNGGAGSTKDSAFWVGKGYKHRWFSWQKTRDLEPSVQNFIFESSIPSNNADKGPELFLLCSYYMNGYGCKPDTNEALRLLQKAATLGHQDSSAFMYRIWQACRPVEENPGSLYLESYAMIGSRAAMAGVEDSFPGATTASLKRWVRQARGGVGADWLGASQMLEGRSQIEWIKDGWLMHRARTATTPLSEIQVNRRGDSILHFVAMCGMWREFKSLILDHKMDVNLQNPLGETPLLSACRAGHGGIVALSLKTFNADASIAAHNGETPLHWLMHFEHDSIEPIVKDMIDKGANIDAASRERISHSYYPASIDIDWRMPGTPLAWAVHDNKPHTVRILLKYGADPNLVPEGAVLSPVVTAAYYHHHECLKILIDFLETRGQIEGRPVILYGPIVIQAEFAADKFSMILRSGADYLRRLHATLDLLREKTEYADFSAQMQGSMLYTAVSKAHDEVVEYMFQKKWLVDTINKPISDAQRTPVLEAIRWNREHLVRMLVDHGADIHAQAANPFAPEESNWSALHIFAHEGHDRDLSLVSQLIDLEFPVDGQTLKRPTPAALPDISTLSIREESASLHSTETPFAVAIRHNASNLANKLLSLGADPNSLSTTAGLFASTNPLTVLGHVIISNARFCQARLNYLLDNPSIDFVVEPTRQLTALHRCAMAHQDVSKRAADSRPVLTAEFDMDTNADIMYELLVKWRQPDELNARCKIKGNTALHLAVLARNSGAVKALVEAGASRSMVNDEGKTAVGVAEEGSGIEAFLERWG
ncbi:MAG: hypothetical protein Q9207_005240 [Kuettlingeria erythrocarpa]